MVTALKEGRLARLRGEAREDNPYSTRQWDRHFLWELGWKDADKDLGREQRGEAWAEARRRLEA